MHLGSPQSKQTAFSGTNSQTVSHQSSHGPSYTFPQVPRVHYMNENPKLWTTNVTEPDTDEDDTMLDRTLPVPEEMERTQLVLPHQREPAGMRGPLAPKRDDDDPSEMWGSVLEALGDYDYETAFKLVLSSGDDIYLLRLMYKTGPDVYRLLKDSTALKLFSRVVAVAKSRFLDCLVLDFFFEACDSHLSATFDEETIQTMLLVLDSIQPDPKDASLHLLLKDFLKSLIEKRRYG